ncbi:MAG TPA: BrnA antitoxin family protein [Rhizomicrobium sp.]|nr:BrnA antitoxin family protein [Rhizomicrobium sp.]
MNLEWDEEKNRTNRAKHGPDFEEARELDWNNATYVEDRRFAYPERRYWAFAMKGGRRTSRRSASAGGMSGSSVFGRRIKGRSDFMAQNKKRIRRDKDIPEMAAADFAGAKKLRTAMPKVVETMKRGRGRPKSPAPKQRVSLRLDPRIVAGWKATGEGWQSRVNDVLAAALPKRGRK